MKILPSGSRGLLLELEDLDEVLTYYAALRAEQLPGVLDIVPAGQTVLLVGDHETDLSDLVSRLRALQPADHRRAPGPAVEVPVRYDGEDLADVAGLLEITVDELVARHRDEEWTVAFCGFAPGFGYLTGACHDWDIPRRTTPRTRVPAGSLALAGAFTGVYPRESPGGWQLIGHAEVEVFDLDRDPAALLTPGARVRFVETR